MNDKGKSVGAAPSGILVVVTSLIKRFSVPRGDVEGDSLVLLSQGSKGSKISSLCHTHHPAL